MRHFGIEIETMVPRSIGSVRPVAHWSVRGDGSLHSGRATTGMEFVSDRLHGSAGIEHALSMVRVLGEYGCHDNASTGLHVHIDAAALTVQQVQMAQHLFRRHEFAFYGTTGTRILRRMAMRAFSGRSDYCKTSNNWGSGYGDRYRGLNTSNWSSANPAKIKNTIEVRCFSPLIDSTHVVSAVTMAHALVAYAADHPVTDPSSPNALGAVERLFGPDRAMTAFLDEIALPAYLPDPDYDYTAVFAHLHAQAARATATIEAH